MLQRYRGLRKEIYVLFYGRVVTSMGAMIWPMMTLILTNRHPVVEEGVERL